MLKFMRMAANRVVAKQTNLEEDRGCGQVVGMLDFYSDIRIGIPLKSTICNVLKLLEKNEKRDGMAHFMNQEQTIQNPSGRRKNIILD